MKYFLASTALILLVALTSMSMTPSNKNDIETEKCLEVPRAIADLSPDEKKEAFAAFVAGSCTYKDIELKGKVKFVDSWPDIKIQYVDSWADIHVKFVDSWPDDCGKWQEVDSWEDFKVQVVTSWPDLKVKKVDSWPGMQ